MKLSIVLLFVIVIYYPLYSQDKLATLGIGCDFESDSSKTAISLNFTFNRIIASSGKAGIYLWSTTNTIFHDMLIDNNKGDIVALVPSIDVNLGNVTSSPNNVLLEVGLTYSKPIDRTCNFLVNIAPAFTSDKNFDTSLYYGDLGVGLYYGIFPSIVSFYVVPAINFNLGRRFETNSTTFYRIVPRLDFSIQFFKSELIVESNSKLYIINNDNAIANGVYHYTSTNINYMLTNNVGLSLAYINGYEEPLFTKMNALTFGIAFYKE